ncbi:MAG: ISNCY family transposase [Planctomycetota bacterium]|jgi:IS5 family transposase
MSETATSQVAEALTELRQGGKSGGERLFALLYKDHQSEFDFTPSNLKLTNEYYRRYEAVSNILNENQRILDLLHGDLKEALRVATGKNRDGSKFKCTSDTVLRIVICHIVEGGSLRDIIIRIDDSHFLRRCVRIYNGPMMDFTTLCKLKNCIRPTTWEKVNRALARYATEHEKIDGDRLRLDTTAVETHIHWPSDSSLLWDSYRVLARLIKRARKIDSGLVGDRRLLTRKARRISVKISRKSTNKMTSAVSLKPLYEKLITLVGSICEWIESVREALEKRTQNRRLNETDLAMTDKLAKEMAHYRHLALRVIHQATRRVLCGEPVSNDEKIFSIFEPHTELLKRGKAGKTIELGHMIQIGQVSSKFITDYAVFHHRPVEHQLVRPALKNHKKLFGEYPATIAADKGYFENMDAIRSMSEKVEMVSIAKKGKRTEEESVREADPEFRFAQRFRAGIEGTISYLKRILGLFRCVTKGWQHFVSTVGATIFTHNLLILARE